MKNTLSSYSTFVFDCDGVLLDSNKLKTEAFHTVASQFGSSAADELVRFHVNNGGISRYKKFEYLLRNIVCCDANITEIERLAAEYSHCVYEALLHCSVAEELSVLRDRTADSTWMVVSGGSQAELQRVFFERGFSELFDGGIFGSPATKDEILSARLVSGDLRAPGLFLGDSRYDHEAATRSGLDFIFIYGWTEFPTWESYCRDHQISSIRQVGDLISDASIM